MMQPEMMSNFFGVGGHNRSLFMHVPFPDSYSKHTRSKHTLTSGFWKFILTFYNFFSGEEREVRQILLHKDLEQFKPEKSLPEFLLRKYVKAVKSSLSNPCSALVPYQPPEKLLSEILNKNEKTCQNTTGQHATSVNEAGVRSRSSSMETDE